jgi:hypothetical protein
MELLLKLIDDGGAKERLGALKEDVSGDAEGCEKEEENERGPEEPTLPTGRFSCGVRRLRRRHRTVSGVHSGSCHALLPRFCLATVQSLFNELIDRTRDKQDWLPGYDAMKNRPGCDFVRG